jgi:hypothetical protein
VKIIAERSLRFGVAFVDKVSAIAMKVVPRVQT